MRIIAGEARGRRIEAPAGTHTRPTLDRVRENLFNMLQGEIADRRVLDLFAGSGALSFEALSRGAENAVLVDLDRRACDVQQKNAETLRYTDRTEIICSDWKRALKAFRTDGRTFDLVFLDPPYAMLDLREVFENLRPLLTLNTLIVLEHETGKEPDVGSGYDCQRKRSWGFCSVRILRRELTPE